MQNIIIRNVTIDDIEKIAYIKIEGWQTEYFEKQNSCRKHQIFEKTGYLWYNKKE